MAHYSKLFNEQKIDVQNRSGFDLSFENSLTMRVGTLTPVLVEEVLPNETYDLGFLTQVQLPPMATDFYGRVDLRLEAFFVPNRIIWGGWQNFMTMPQNNPYNSHSVRPASVPYFTNANVAVSTFNNVFGPGSLSDYLGVKAQLLQSNASAQTITVPNILPYLAYHKIYDDWYRNSKIQNPVFVKPAGSIGSGTSALKYAPYAAQTIIAGDFDASFGDVTSWYQLRQRNWAKDYYTTAALYPQASGDLAGSTVTADESGTFSIGALRAANTLQRWLDRNNIAGERYADQIKATFGVYPSDSTTDRALFLGAESIGIYNKSVYTTANAGSSNQNPFSNLAGAKTANAQAVGDGQLIDSFHSTEHGYLFVIASIVPHATYSTGTRRMFLHNKIGDFANPLLQGLGEQAIYNTELTNKLPTSITDYGDIFGYQQQYSEYKYHDDEVHGKLRDGETLDAFSLQRSFGAAPTLGTDFVQIPTDYMNQVTAVADYMSNYGAWANFYFSFKKVSPLSEYVIPTLGDLKDVHTETIPYRGTML